MERNILHLYTPWLTGHKTHFGGVWDVPADWGAFLFCEDVLVFGADEDEAASEKSTGTAEFPLSAGEPGGGVTTTGAMRGKRDAGLLKEEVEGLGELSGN